MKHIRGLVALLARVQAEIPHHADDFERRFRGGDTGCAGIPQAGAKRRRDPVLHEAAYERFIDDHRSGRGTEVAAMEAASGDDRAVEGLEKTRADRRDREASLERRTGAGRDVDGRGPIDRQRCPGTRSANVTATTPGSFAICCSSLAYVRARRSSKADVVSSPAGRSNSRRAVTYS